MSRRPRFLLDELLEREDLDADEAKYLRVAVRVIADEPMRWYYEESEQEYWHEPTEFRNVAPHYPVLWIEFSAPKFVNSEVHGRVEWPNELWSRGGVLVASGLANEEAIEYRGAKWISRASVYMNESQFGPPGRKWTFVYGVGEDGSLVLRDKKQDFETIPDPNVRETAARSAVLFTGDTGKLTREIAQEIVREIGMHMIGLMRVAMLTIYFMHAKNTELRPVRVPRKVAEGRRERGEPTGEGYRILDVGLGARRELAEERARGGGSQGALRRLHIRRGHFATYGPDRPHVSGFVGTLWRRPTVAGSSEAPMLKKDYRAKAADAHQRKKHKRRGKR